MTSSPHSKLRVPLDALGPNEIRILILHPSSESSHLKASVEIRKLPTYERDSLQINNDRGQRISETRSGGDHEKEHTEPQLVKYLHVGDMVYPVPMDYTGDGSEFNNYRHDDNEGSESIVGSAGPGSKNGYEAISYVWGEPVYSKEIELEDHGVLQITESLHGALHRFRLKNLKRKLWADAVCINQGNMGERSAQVAIMAEIYKQAAGVLIWLGPAQETDALAFATVRIFLDEQEKNVLDVYENLGKLLGEIGYCQCCSERYDVTEHIAPRGLLAVGSLIRRSWFSRLWVV